jgi:transcriptional regulator with XRE-family HTH domain
MVRDEEGLSRAELCYKLRTYKAAKYYWPISESTLSNYESGRTFVPRDRVKSLAKALRCSERDLR